MNREHLKRLLRPRHIAVEMFLTGRSMDAEEAARWGLVNKMVPAEALMIEAHAMAAHIAEGAPLEDAMKLTKIGSSGLPIHEKMMASEDAIEGPIAFAEKRKPIWEGR